MNRILAIAVPILAWPTFDASNHDPPNQSAQFGLIPQDCSNTFGYSEAAAQCKIIFGQGWDLAIFDSTEQMNEVTTFAANGGYTEAFWVGYKNSANGQIDHFGDVPKITFRWNRENIANPEPNGIDTDCVRVKDALFNDVACTMDRTGLVSDGVGMGVMCRHYPSLEVNTKKSSSGPHYCDVGAIGLAMATNPKYIFKCKKGRFDRENLIVKLGKNHKKEWLVSECTVKCKLDKDGRNKLSAKFECHPVLDENNKIIGARSVYDERGFQQYQQICGSGCAPSAIREYLGPTGAQVSTGLCDKGNDIHSPANLIPKSSCFFTCDSADGQSQFKTRKKISCFCEGATHRTCSWKLKLTRTYHPLDTKNTKWNSNKYYLPLLFDEEKCYVTPTTSTTTATTTTITTTTTTTTTTTAPATTTTTTTTTTTQASTIAWDGTGLGPWEAWSACTVTCGRGYRYTRRPYESGLVVWTGTLYGSDAEKGEPCNLMPCDTVRTCKLEMSDVDWSMAVIGHRDDPDQTWNGQVYIDMGVYYNHHLAHTRRETPHTLTGHFPDGIKVANVRCVQVNLGGKYESHKPNYGAEFHSATCNCDDENNCEWDRMMPNCNEIGQHPGYMWVMDTLFQSNAGQRVTTGLESGSGICVSALTGAVGYITADATCHIDAAGYVPSQSKYLRDTYDDSQPNFRNMFGPYPASTPEDNKPRDETEFISLYSAAADAFKWEKLTWEDNFNTFDGSFVEDGVAAPMRYMSLPAGAVHVPMGANQWGIHQAHTDNPFVCKLTYLNDLDSNGDPKVFIGRLRRDPEFFEYNQRPRYDCGGKILYSHWPCCVGSAGCNSQCGIEKFMNETMDFESIELSILIADPDEYVTDWTAWSDCSNSCGGGTQSRSKKSGNSVVESRECEGSCPGLNLCRPWFFNYWRRTTEDYNLWGGQWATQQRGMSIQCDGEGYNKHDIISGDNIYIGVDTEKCHLTSTDFRYTVVFSYDESTQANNEYNGGITCLDRKDAKPEHNTYKHPYPIFGKFQFFEPDVPRLVLNVCYLPTDNAASGLTGGKGTFKEIKCSGGEQLENGDWIVPLGAHCTAYCEAPYRFEGGKDRWTCSTRVPTDQFETSEWDTMLRERSSYFNGKEVIPWGFRGSGSNYLDAAHGGCKYKIAAGHERCATPDLMKTENEDAVIWDCDDGFESGSKCVKRCNAEKDWMMKMKESQKKVDLECYCKGTCKWKGWVSPCSQKGCEKPPDGAYPLGPDYSAGLVSAMCETALGEPVDYATALSDNWWSEGVRCWKECKPGYAEYVGNKYTTCVCDDNTCAFNNKAIARCVEAACNTDIQSLASEFEKGFDYFYNPDLYYYEDGFTPDTSHFKAVECEQSGLWDFGNPQFDGKAKPGTTCRVTCQDGYKPFPGRPMSMTCGVTFHHQYEWDILTDNWDVAGDCHSDYGYQCDGFPACVPE